MVKNEVFINSMFFLFLVIYLAVKAYFWLFLVICGYFFGGKSLFLVIPGYSWLLKAIKNYTLP
jgi:hypothetical protein